MVSNLNGTNIKHAKSFFKNHTKKPLLVFSVNHFLITGRGKAILHLSMELICLFLLMCKSCGTGKLLICLTVPLCRKLVNY